MTRRRRTGESSDIGTAYAVTTRQITRHFALGRNIDLETLSNERIDARLDVRRIDELITTIRVFAHQSSICVALRFAGAFELRITANVAIQVFIGSARAHTTGRTRFLTRARRSLRTRFATTTGTACFRVSDAITTWVLGIALRNERLLAFRHASTNAIERRRIAIVHAFGITRIRAIRNGLRFALTITTRLKVQR